MLGPRAHSKSVFKSTEEAKNKLKQPSILLTVLLLAPLAALHSADQRVPSARPDIVLADFEQGYGQWTVKGEAFNHSTTDVRGGVKGFAGIKPDLFDIEFEWDASQQKDFRLSIWDREVFVFNAKDSTFSVNGEVQEVAPVNGTSKVRIICDRSLCSFYFNDGYEAGNRYLGKFRPERKEALKLQGDAGQVFKTFQVRSLRPRWKTAETLTSGRP